jgi:hypothetical protein
MTIETSTLSALTRRPYAGLRTKGEVVADAAEELEDDDPKTDADDEADDDPVRDLAEGW